MTNYAKVPVDYMVDGVRRYIEYGIRPGHFLQALFSNDLKESFKRADYANLAAMQKWVAFIYWEMPAWSQGSARLVDEWIAAGGEKGLDAVMPEETSDGR